MAIDLKELGELLGAIAANNITELTLKNADFELTVSQGNARSIAGGSISTTIAEIGSQTIEIPTADAQQMALEKAAAPTIDTKWVAVKSPMVGTFYRSPAPDEPPFASIGDRIRVGQTVCIIEAMKLMNEIESEIVGQVMEVLVENGQPIEFGQPLMYVNPG
jgi:acetyl-CoA carboxylase biotin carboxyl carrier protein